ncbi:MAG: ATP-binding cassette domain-containing protein, partial [Sphingomonas bacterium]|nr:ATP-binding cassette domain-containing protein [Sphingomonas bacterium]
MMIHARNVTLTLGSGESATEILRGIDLDVCRGERLAILGASGSGKSSLMAVLSGLERATSGKVVIVGENFSSLDEDGLA